MELSGVLPDRAVCLWLSPGVGAFAGVLAFFGLAAFEQVLVLAGSHGRWLGAAIFAIAGIYQLTSFKDVCLRHCRSPMSLLN